MRKLLKDLYEAWLEARKMKADHFVKTHRGF